MLVPAWLYILGFFLLLFLFSFNCTVMKQVILAVKEQNDLVLTLCWAVHTQPDNLWLLFNQGKKTSVNESVLFVLFYCPTENRNGNTKTNPSTLVPSLQRTQHWSTAGGFSQGVKIEQAYGEEKKKCPSAKVSKIRNADWCVQISWNWAGTKTTGKLDQVYTQIREYSLF